MGDPWPSVFERVPDEDWTRQPVENLARGYDTVENHGWYDNLDPTVHDAARFVDAGDLVVDYSAGTGIFADRLLDHPDAGRIGVLAVDSSAKFLRLALDKLGDDERVAFRHIPYCPDENRITRMQEVLEASMLERGVEALVSTNAIHLYYGLDETLESWRSLLQPGGQAFVQSGNIAQPEPTDAWIIDETVHEIHDQAREIVREDDAYAAYRDVLEDPDRMQAYDALREKFFVPLRELDHYLDALTRAGFDVIDVSRETITARTDEWREFLSVYDEGVLGWVGGSPRVEDTEPSKTDLEARGELIDRAMDRVFDGEDTFEAVWTHVTCRKPS
jgi:SAM-dependent methyltransferase